MNQQTQDLTSLKNDFRTLVQKSPLRLGKSKQQGALTESERRKVESALESTFGLQELRPMQAEVIHSVLQGQPTLAIMPTGAGKSLCYQIPATLSRGTTVVVSPLIALMKDQKEKLDELEIAAVELNSSLSAADLAAGFEALAQSSAGVVYVTPERLADPEFLSTLATIDIGLFVIDEAHCLSQWGHDFRPAYLSVPEVWKALGEPPLLALTATATSAVIDDLKEQLQIPRLKIFQTGVLRDNLHYEARHLETEAEKLQALLQDVELLTQSGKKSGIIYAATIKNVELIYEHLINNGVRAVRYHGKLSAKNRLASQEEFMSGAADLIVATNAFGMGIDKPDIRFVIHFNFPGSLEAYYQESGRAGRDGDQARCILLYLKQDKRTQSFFLAGKYPSVDEVRTVYAALAKDKTLDSVAGISKTKFRVISKAWRDAIEASASPKEYSESNVEKLAEAYVEKGLRDREKLKQMIVYSQTALCRWKSLLRYFEQAVEWELCHHCDNCERETSRLAMPS